MARAWSISRWRCAGAMAGVLLLLVTCRTAVASYTADDGVAGPENVLGSVDAASFGDVPPAEVAALTTFYTSTEGGAWLNNTGWLVDPNPCTWYGVSCSVGWDGGLHVTGVSLPRNGLRGSLTFGTAPDLHFLRTLSVPHNGLRGLDYTSVYQLNSTEVLDLSHNPDMSISANDMGVIILAQLNVLRILRLDNTGMYGNWNTQRAKVPLSLEEISLSQNRLTTSILYTICGTPRPALRRLDLHGMLLTDELCYLFAPNLEYIDLSDNRLNYAMDDKLCLLTGAKTLRMGSNFRVTGSLPACMGSAMGATLQVLDIDNAALTGSLPASFANFTALHTLLLQRNKLSGSLGVLQNLTSLQVLRLSDNAFTGPPPLFLFSQSHAGLQELTLSGTNFSGPLPALDALPSLRVLRMADTRVTGVLPPLATATPTLQVLELAGNDLRSPLPSSLPPDIEYLDLSGNAFAEPFPSSILTSTSLHTLLLNDNAFTGALPAQLASLPNLTTLALQGNNFTGLLPQTWNGPLEVVNLASNAFTGPLPPAWPASLAFLNLHRNALTGSLPSSYGDTTQHPLLQYVDVGSNGITGSVPRNVFSSSSLRVLDASRNQLTSVDCAEGADSNSSLQELSLTGNNFTAVDGSQLLHCLAQLPQLAVVDLSSTLLPGELPASFSLSPSLISLDLSGNALSGTVPASWGAGTRVVNDILGTAVRTASRTLPQLRVLRLRSNALTGALSPLIRQLSNLASLSVLDLAENNFTGPLLQEDLMFVPAGVSAVSALEDTRISSSLTSLSIGGRRLEGPLPPLLPESLLLLDVSKSPLLAGIIPDTYSNLKILLASQCPLLRGGNHTCYSRAPGGSGLRALDNGGSSSLYGGGSSPAVGVNANATAFFIPFESTLPCFVQSNPQQLITNAAPACTCEDVTSSNRVVTMDPGYDAYGRCKCVPGTYGLGCNCTACPAGSTTLTPGATTVDQCQCPAGSFGNVTVDPATGAAVSLRCDPCPVGTYSPTAGSRECYACPLNSITLTNGCVAMSQCLCNAGTFPFFPNKRRVPRSIEGSNQLEAGVEASDTAVATEVGTADGGGGGRQLQAGGPQDYFVCARCGANQYKATEGQYSCTLCPNGFYSLPGSAKCLPCASVGVRCGAGVSTVLPGYWPAPFPAPLSSTTSSSGGDVEGVADATGLNITYYQCLWPPACVVSSDGYSAGCAEGYTGPLCGACARGYGRPLASSCKACPSRGSSAVAALMLLVLFFAYCGLLVWRHQNDGRREVAVMMRILLHHVQLTCLLLRYVPSVPAQVQTWLGPILFLDVTALLSFPAQCWLSPSFTDLASLHLYFPLLLTGTAITLFAGLALYWQLPKSAVRSIATSAAITLLFIVYPALVRWVATTFWCVSVGPLHVLAEDTTVSCDAPEYSSAVTSAGFIIVLYLLGIPAFGFSRLYMLSRAPRADGAAGGAGGGPGGSRARSRSPSINISSIGSVSKGAGVGAPPSLPLPLVAAPTLHDPEIRHRFGFLYNGLRLPQHTEDGHVLYAYTYLWHAVVMARQLCVIAITVSLSYLPSVQLAALWMFLTAALCLQLYAYPYITLLHNRLEGGGLLCLVATLFLLMLHSRRGAASSADGLSPPPSSANSDSSDASDGSDPEIVLMLLINISFLVACFVISARRGWRAFRHSRDLRSVPRSAPPPPSPLMLQLQAPSQAAAALALQHSLQHLQAHGGGGSKKLPAFMGLLPPSGSDSGGSGSGGSGGSAGGTSEDVVVMHSAPVEAAALRHMFEPTSATSSVSGEGGGPHQHQHQQLQREPLFVRSNRALLLAGAPAAADTPTRVANPLRIAAAEMGAGSSLLHRLRGAAARTDAGSGGGGGGRGGSVGSPPAGTSTPAAAAAAAAPTAPVAPPSFITLPSGAVMMVPSASSAAAAAAIPATAASGAQSPAPAPSASRPPAPAPAQVE